MNGNPNPRIPTGDDFLTRIRTHTGSFQAIPPFPLYPRQGETLVRVRTLENRQTVTVTQLRCLVEFHRYVLSNLLCLDKCNMKFSFDEAANSLLFVPVRRGGIKCFCVWGVLWSGNC